MKMFSLVEFEKDKSVSVVSTQWLTPLKTKVWWPPLNTQHAFEKALKAHEQPSDEAWTLYKIKKFLYQTGKHV